VWDWLLENSNIIICIFRSCEICNFEGGKNITDGLCKAQLFDAKPRMRSFTSMCGGKSALDNAAQLTVISYFGFGAA